MSTTEYDCGTEELRLASRKNFPGDATVPDVRSAVMVIVAGSVTAAREGDMASTCVEGEVRS
jgi:hypothetical protein